MKKLLKEKLEALIKAPPKPAMSADNLYAYLDAIYHKRNVAGPVLEIGCANGGSTAFACWFLSRIGCKKQYCCIDTFGGFVENQLQTDHRLGLTSQHDNLFRRNSVKKFRSKLERWGIRRNVTIIEGDICAIPEEQIPDNLSVVLVDVDLRDPIYHGLRMVDKKLASNGIILVDDCKQGTSWVGANAGYRDYIAERGLSPKYYMGLGVVEHSTDGSLDVPWLFSETPNPIVADYYR